MTDPGLPPWLYISGEDVRLEVVVAPRASRTRVMGVHDSRLKIQLAAPPVDNKANEALVRFLADTLGVARAQVEIIAGASNKRKTVRVAGVTETRVLVKLSPRQEG